MMFIFIIVIRPTSFSHLTSGIKIVTSDLKQDYFHTFHDIAQFLLSVFELATCCNCQPQQPISRNT